MKMPDYDNMSMDEIFKLDSSERIKAMTQLILELERKAESSIFDDAMREAHSLKAAARVVNNIEVQNLAHKMEEIFQITKEENKRLSSDYVDLFLENLDAMNEISIAFVEEQTHQIDVNAMIDRLEDAKKGVFKVCKELTLKQTQPEGDNGEDTAKPFEEKRDPRGSDSTEKKNSVEHMIAGKKITDSTVRVGIEKLDTMMNLSGEIYTNTLYLERERERLDKIMTLLNPILSDFEVIKLFSPQRERENNLEIFQEKVSQIHGGIIDFQRSILSYSQTINDLTVSFGYLGAQLQDEVMRSRMLPVSMIFEPHVRLIRDITHKDGKNVRLVIEGGDTLVDKTVLEILRDPLTHLVRNACDHGIERMEARIKASKTEEGTLTLSAYYQSGRVMIEVKDDGHGIDLERLKKKIIEKEIVTMERMSTMSRQEILNVVFLSGFSTAEKVTPISGRGIGLDVVKSNLSSIGGRVTLETAQGQFTRFLLSLPFTLAITRSLLVDSGGQKFCFPLTRVEEISSVKKEHIKIVEGKDAVDVRGEIISMVSLSELWRLSDSDVESDIRELVIIGQGREKVALWVDKLLETQEIVSKVMDKRLKDIYDISGGCVLDNGEIAFIVDVDSLLRSIADYTGKSLVSRVDEGKHAKRKRILVVEDALTVRELEKKTLINNGYDVVTAVDGLEGFYKCRESKFDLIVTDIEMPRMDGFEMIRKLKMEDKSKDIPMVIVSFKEREEDKRRGMEVGADRYITKSKYDSEILLDTIARLIGT